MSDLERKLGKLSKVEFGLGGYQDAMIGLSVTIEGKGWVSGDFISGFWGNSIEHSDYCKWTEESRQQARSEMVGKVNKLLDDAKCQSVSDLNGVPVEATFDGNKLVSWRILTEVV